ncbi:hypothetical protein PRIC1_004781 [Phytophthora ramorum]
MTQFNEQPNPTPDRSTATWSARYFEQQQELRGKQKLANKMRPAAIGAALAVFGRIVVMPVMLLTVFGVTGYLSTGTFLIEYKNSYLAYSQMDLVMSGGCTPCHTLCKRVMHQFYTFKHEALMSKPTFEDLYTVTSWDYSVLTDDELALAERLEASGAICSGGVDEWGSPLSIITGTAAEVVEIIGMMNLSVTPLELAEAKKGIETKDECVTRWAVEAHLRLFMFQAVKNSIDYSSIPAADFNVYPEYADCRPAVASQGLISEKQALSTAGEDLVAVVPDILKLFPYSFSSSLPVVSRTLATTSPTIYNVKAVNQSLFRGYYGGCRVTTVNTTGVFIEDTCPVVKHWANYGLMLQAPDDIPVCTTAVLYSVRSKSLSWIVDYNGQLLRKTTTLGKKYCGLHDSCFLMNINLAVVVAVISTVLGLVALSASFFVQKRYGKKLGDKQAKTASNSSTKVSIQAKGANRYIVHNSKSASLTKLFDKKNETKELTGEDKTTPSPLTTFEEHCLGSPFTRLFKDCDDFACVQYMGKTCTSVEALLLTGYLFYGQHVYQAGSVVLLLLARLIPRKLLRTFNVLLIRWYMDPEHGTLTHALSCTWFAASAENYKISEATPVA